jgi:tRNA(fMet)-specific endonuclease VapC
MFLDTSYCVDLFRENNNGIRGPATLKLKSLENTPVYISIFVLCELHSGAQLSKYPGKELRKIELFSEYLEIVYPDRVFPVLYGETESFLRKNGTPIPVMDLLIGITSKQYGMPLLTRDDKHFKHIPGLIIENYNN